MAKKCFYLINGKYYDQDQYEKLLDLYSKKAEGQDVNEQIKSILDQGVDFEDVESTTNEEVDDSQRFTQKALNEMLAAIGSAYQYASSKIGLNETISKLINEGKIKRVFDVTHASNVIADIEYKGATSYEDVVVLSSIITNIAKERVLQVNEISVAKSRGEDTTMMESKLNDLVDYAGLVSDVLSTFGGTNAGRTLAYIKNLNMGKFDGAVEKRKAEKEFKGKITEGTYQDIENVIDKITELEAEKEALENEQILESEGKNEKVADEHFNSLVEGIKRGAQTTKGKVSELYGKLRNYFSGSIKFQDDNIEDSMAEMNNNIIETIKELYKEGKVNNTNEVVEEITSNNPNITKEDIYNALALHADNNIKEEAYKKELKQVRFIETRLADIRKGLVKLSDLDPGEKKVILELNKIRSKVQELQRFYLYQFTGLNYSSKDTFDDLVDVEEQLKKIDEAVKSGKNLTAEQKRLAIKDAITNANISLSKANEAKQIATLTKALDKLKKGIIPDTKRSTRPVYSAKVYKLKSQIKDLRNELKVKEAQGKIESEYGWDNAKYNRGIILGQVLHLPIKLVLAGDFGPLTLHLGLVHLKQTGQLPRSIVNNVLKSGLKDGVKTAGKEYIANMKQLASLWLLASKSLINGLRNAQQARKFIENLYAEQAYSEEGAFASQMGLKLTKPFSEADIKTRDDFFESRSFRDLKGDNKMVQLTRFTLGRFETISEGVYVNTLNTQRIYMAKAWIKNNPLATVAETKEAMEHINNMTGTTNKLNIGYLNRVFTAPKLYASRLKLIYRLPLDIKGIFTEEDPAIREAKKYIVKQRLGNVIDLAVGYTALTFAMSLMGWDYEEDPRNKNFGKMVKKEIGDDIPAGSTLDISAGTLKWIMPVIKYFRDTYEGEFLDGIYGKRGSSSEREDPRQDFFSESWLALRYLLTPSINTFLSAATGKNAIGESLGTDIPSSVRNWLAQSLAPLFLQPMLVKDLNVYSEKEVSSTELGAKFLGLALTNKHNNLNHPLVQEQLDAWGMNGSTLITKGTIRDALPESVKQLELFEKPNEEVKESEDFKEIPFLKAKIDILRTEAQNEFGNRLIEKLLEAEGNGEDPKKSVTDKQIKVLAKEALLDVVAKYQEYYGEDLNGDFK